MYCTYSISHREGPKPFVLLHSAWFLLCQTQSYIELGRVLAILRLFFLLFLGIFILTYVHTHSGVAKVRTNDIVNRHAVCEDNDIISSNDPPVDDQGLNTVYQLPKKG